MPSRLPHGTIEIRDVTNRELVTAIEVLSPTNKRGDGYREYLDKRRRILSSMAHLMEIDLLRKGEAATWVDEILKAFGSKGA